ncbi:phosphotransferase family protein [Alkalibacterium sp. MB6]|uniref:phosphotransferase family protein n=1 Tax=Alkalibacterium sp. MB6 TaxID=2081965 RepID=UPI00137A4E73|nr:phosphotransferase family protein [Alkalibacterium sp. MB6]
MELERETGWQLHPIGGDTGTAYMGTKNEEVLFLKRNSSPFLAALSLEGISPKLVWTKRIGNGDVLTAQEWCSGRTLHREEMDAINVSDIIQKVHGSKSLKRMLHRLGGKVYKPSDFYYDCVYKLAPDLMSHPLIKQAMAWLKNNLPEPQSQEDSVVCHGDISHKNLLLSEDQELFLVDWDSVILSDPLYDIAQLLVRYIKPIDWNDWLERFAYYDPSASQETLYWYVTVHLILDIKSNHGKRQFIDMNQNLLKLNHVLALFP